MFSDNNKISGRQVFRLLTYDLLGVGTLLIPTALAKLAGRDGIFCIGAGVVAGLLYLRLLAGIVSDMKEDYYTYAKEQFGTFFTKLVWIGYLIYFVLLAGYTSHLFGRLVLENLLREESFWLVLAVILLLAAYGLVGGLEGRARVYEILFWFLMVPLFFMMGSALDEIEPDYWAPIFSTNASGFFSGTYFVFQWLALAFLLLFLARSVKKKEMMLRAGRKAILFTGGIYAAMYLILIGMFGTAALAEMDFPAVTMMSTVKAAGGFFKRADALMFGVWFFTLYALLNGAAFYGGAVLKSLTHAHGERRFGILVLIAAAVVAGIFYRSVEACETYEILLWYVGTPFILLVPILLTVTRLVHRKKEAVE